MSKYKAVIKGYEAMASQPEQAEKPFLTEEEFLLSQNKFVEEYCPENGTYFTYVSPFYGWDGDDFQVINQDNLIAHIVGDRRHDAYNRSPYSPEWLQYQGTQFGQRKNLSREECIPIAARMFATIIQSTMLGLSSRAKSVYWENTHLHKFFGT